MGVLNWVLIRGVLAAFSLAALLALSELEYNILKWCGALYLCWLGMQLITRPRRVFDTRKVENSSSSNWFLRGMRGNVLNPKMSVFYISFLSQLIPSGHSPVIWTFLLVSIHIVMGTLCCLTLIFATKYTSRLLKKRVSLSGWIVLLAGCLCYLQQS